MALTFNEMPQAVEMIKEKVDSLFSIISKKENNKPEPDRWFTMDEVVDYDPEKRSKATWYLYTSTGKVPFHKRNKKILFLKSEIDAWLLSGRKKTVDEINNEVNAYLAESKKRQRK